MPENASYVFIHHYIEGTSNLSFGMTCCIVLTVVIVFILVILLGIVIYVVVASKRRRHSGKAKITETTSRENHSFKDLMDDASSLNAVSTQTSIARDPDVKSLVQGIPLSTFRKLSKTNDRLGDSSGSSAGLYEVLFPEQHEGEIIFHPPPTKTVKFDGKALSSSRKSSLIDSNPGPSGLNGDNASGSLDWDYFQQNLVADRQSTSFVSDGELEANPKHIRSICWV